jgi:trehalose 6-phosphate synthase
MAVSGSGGTIYEVWSLTQQRKEVVLRSVRTPDPSLFLPAADPSDTPAEARRAATTGTDRAVVGRPAHGALEPHARDATGSHDVRTADLPDRLIVVSNRGPVEHGFGADGVPIGRRGAGGVVSGLLCALGERPATWISLAMTDADRAVAAMRRPVRAPGERTRLDPRPDVPLDLRLVDVPADRYRRYYEGISNRVLWFAQHYLLYPTSGQISSARTQRDWRDGYCAVNDAVAEAVLAELRAHPGAPVLFQDYHLYLAPERVRARRPDAQLASFVHIPWPEARYWDLLPDEMTRAIFRGLASNDLIGFQTERDAANFLDGAVRFLDCAERLAAGPSGGALRWDGRRVLARAYPIAVSPAEVRACAETPAARAAYDTLRDELGLDDLHRLIVRVDRIEPTKNIVRGFRAFERLLAAHPEHRGRVTFLALLVPSRQHMAEYRSCERQVHAAIDRVNARFGRPGWRPIVAICGNDRARALACMRRYDVLLVNPLIDGMNLVVKEGGLLNTRGGVVLLSRTAGAYEQLAEHVLGIAPCDVAGTAETLYTALTMPAEARAILARGLRGQLQKEDARHWLIAQLRDLRALARPAAARPTVAGASASHPLVERWSIPGEDLPPDLSPPAETGLLSMPS